MAEIFQYKHTFDFYYKWCPTASGQLLDAAWWTRYNSGSGNVMMSGSWYDLYPLGYGISTRHKPAISGSEGALAWASAATDMLWNVKTPSMSISQSLNAGSGRAQTFYRFTYNSASLLYNNFFPAPISVGIQTYPVTSSWVAYEPKMVTYALGTGSGVGYEARGVTYPNYFPATLQTPANAYSLPSSASLPTTTYPNVGQNPTKITYGNASTGSNDGRFFDLAGGCGITRTSISESFVAFNVSASINTAAARQFCTTQLKNRRLFFPTVRTTGSITSDMPDYWVYVTTGGRTTNQFFTENGGIYNVKFNLKRDVARGYYPDTGEDSQLLVFIHDINKIIPTPSGRIPGAAGWYPPDNNIVRIKNNPAMSFINPATGYLIESFNINVVQYGTPAQLVFEASGSLNSDQYFGCIVDDVEFCKIGVTTDPSLIKPTTTAQYIEAEEQQFES